MVSCTSHPSMQDMPSRTREGIPMCRLGLAVLISISALVPVASGLRAQEPGANWLAEVFRAFGQAIRERDERFAEEYADRWRYYEVTISFSVEGQDFEISRAFACEPTISGYEFVQINYRRDGDRLVKRLPSGAALVFGAPNICSDTYEWQRSSDGYFVPTIDLHPGYVPLAIWLDDADNPTRAELYVSEIYYEGPSPRIRIHTTRVAGVAAPQATASDPSGDEQLVLGNLQGLRGIFATVIPRDIWSQIPDIDEFLTEFAEFQNFTLEDSSRISSKSLYHWDSHRTRQSRILGIPTAGSQYRQNERVRAASRRVYPVEMTDGGFEIGFPTPGVIVLSRDAPIPTEFELRIGSGVLPGQLHQYWQFDPESGLLLSVQMQTLSFL